MDFFKTATPAIAFLYTTGFLFALVLAYQIAFTKNDPNMLAVGIVNLVIGYVINSAGVAHGVNSTNSTAEKTIASLNGALSPHETNVSPPSESEKPQP